MQFTQQLAVRLRDSVRAEPLTLGEMRRIEGLGELYVASPETVVDDKQYTEVYSVKVDDVPVVLYVRHVEDLQADSA